VEYRFIDARLHFVIVHHLRVTVVSCQHIGFQGIEILTLSLSAAFKTFHCNYKNDMVVEGSSIHIKTLRQMPIILHIAFRVAIQNFKPLCN
jgi:hypothetical protein